MLYSFKELKESASLFVTISVNTPRAAPPESERTTAKGSISALMCILSKNPLSNSANEFNAPEALIIDTATIIATR